MKLNLIGEMVEIGRLEDEDGADGFVLRRDDESFVTVKGLSMDEVRSLAPMFLDRTELTVVAAGEA